jgi:hypothetical protein
MPKQRKTKTDRSVPEAEAKREHDQRSGKAKAGSGETRSAGRKGTSTTKPMSKAKPNRDRVDNKKVQSGR